eukprot:354797_1
MGWFTKQLSLNNKKLLVSGYSRERYQGLVPTVLIKLIRWYLDEVLYWSMEGNFLKRFCKKETGQILYSSGYNYKDIEFCSYWYPNGNEKAYEDQVIFGVTLSKLPKHIEQLTIYYRLQCDAFNCVWKSIHTFDHSESNTNCIGWNPFNLKLSQCKDRNKIDFNCYINVLRIVYRNEHNKSIEATTESIDSCSEVTKYNWLIPQAQMSAFLACETGQTFYSANFGGARDDSYCLFIAPKGFRLDSEHLMVYLRLLRLPMITKRMTISYTLKVVYTLSDTTKKVKVKETKSTKLGYAFNECTKQCVVNKIPSIVGLTSLAVYINIKIQEIVDLNDKIIPKYHWEKYGVAMNQNKVKLFQKLL